MEEQTKERELTMNRKRKFSEIFQTKLSLRDHTDNNNTDINRPNNMEMNPLVEDNQTAVDKDAKDAKDSKDANQMAREQTNLTLSFVGGYHRPPLDNRPRRACYPSCETCAGFGCLMTPINIR